MVKKPRSREDHRGWFNILRRGKRSFVEALQNQETERNPLETDNEDRCTMIAWEAMQHYIGSSEFMRMYKKTFNTYDKDSFLRQARMMANKGVGNILVQFQKEETVPIMGWKELENQLFGSSHTTDSNKLRDLLKDLKDMWVVLEFKDNYFANVIEWLDSCLSGGPLHRNVNLHYRHNKWFQLKEDRETTKPRKQESTNTTPGDKRRKLHQPNAETWDEWNALFLELKNKYRGDRYSSPGSMNK